MPSTPADDPVATADELRLAGRWDDAIRLLRGSLDAARGAGDGQAATVLAALARTLNDRDLFGGVDSRREALACLDEAAELAERSGDPAMQGAVWDARGMTLHCGFLRERGGEPPGELEAFERALELQRRAHDVRGVAESTFHVALVHQVIRGDEAAAAPYLREAGALARNVDDPIITSYVIRHEAFSRQEVGDLEGAHAGFAESLRLREEAGFVAGAAMARLALADVLAAAGDGEAAREHLAVARRTFEWLGAKDRVREVEDALTRLGGEA